MMKDMKDMVDVFGGKVTLEQLGREVRWQMYHGRKLRRMVIDITRRKKGYYSTIYIPIADFGKSK